MKSAEFGLDGVVVCEETVAMNKTHAMTRREMLRGSVALAALAFAQSPLRAFGFKDPGESDIVLPFVDQQPAAKGLRWEQLTDWVTPNEQVFNVQHYGVPEFNSNEWHLEISGLVKKSRTFTLQDIKARKATTVTATLECSGNGSNAGFMGAIGNAPVDGLLTPQAARLNIARSAKSKARYQRILSSSFGRANGLMTPRRCACASSSMLRHCVCSMREGDAPPITLRPACSSEAFDNNRTERNDQIGLLTGDNPCTAAALAAQLKVRYGANLLPEDKIAIV
jgi:hypothetical protein